MEDATSVGVTYGHHKTCCAATISCEQLWPEMPADTLDLQAARCLAELGVPHYHHEFVKRALVAGFEVPKAAPALLALLKHLGDSNQITQVGAAACLHLKQRAGCPLRIAGAAASHLRQQIHHRGILQVQKNLSSNVLTLSSLTHPWGIYAAV